MNLENFPISPKTKFLSYFDIDNTKVDDLVISRQKLITGSPDSLHGPVKIILLTHLEKKLKIQVNIIPSKINKPQSFQALYTKKQPRIEVYNEDLIKAAIKDIF